MGNRGDSSLMMTGTTPASASACVAEGRALNMARVEVASSSTPTAPCRGRQSGWASRWGVAAGCRAGHDAAVGAAGRVLVGGTEHRGSCMGAWVHKLH